MKDLTLYNNEELTNHVFNDTYFWDEREDLPYLFDLINEEFITTKDQRANLLAELSQYKKDMSDLVAIELGLKLNNKGV
jgi:GH18 family chitinase